MSGIWKNNIGLSIFGESHGPAIGITLSGVQAGIKLDLDFIQSELDRRKPGQNALTTSRKETDQLEILSGYFNGFTTGAPLTVMIRNNNTRSKDYEALRYKPRPGHADYPGYIKYKGFNDYRGGGHFSGRLTAGIVFAGAVAKEVLKQKGIEIYSLVTQISDIKEDLSTLVDPTLIKKVQEKEMPVISDVILENMMTRILSAKENKDSVGGKIRCFAFGVKPGIGNPYFDSFESILSHLMFSVPAVKGIHFGNEHIAEMVGSEANDEYVLSGGIKTETNNNGGILGGITNGMPIDFTVSIKPTPSIAKQQKTIDLELEEEVDLLIEGRHDPCIIPRVLPVIESVLAITILDLL